MENKNISVNPRSSAVSYSAVAETNNFIVLDKYNKLNDGDGNIVMETTSPYNKNNIISCQHTNQ